VPTPPELPGRLAESLIWKKLVLAQHISARGQWLLVIMNWKSKTSPNEG